MDLNSTPSSHRVHIGFFGLRNAGKSSLVNKIAGQEISLVSDVLGTTTDPVKKAMELLPLGAVMLVDTAGLDDEGELGRQRVRKTLEELERIDAAVLVSSALEPLSKQEEELLAQIKAKKIPFIIAKTKADLLKEAPNPGSNEFFLSSSSGEGIESFKKALALIVPQKKAKPIASDLISEGQIALLVTPIDAAAPKGRLILPQQQTVRDLLDNHQIPILCQPQEIEGLINSIGEKIALVITDSAAFAEVSKKVPKHIPITSFSILFARFKGELSELIEGAEQLSLIKEGEEILISEGCTHRRQCGDIGSVKIPRMLQAFTNANVKITLSSGNDFPSDLSKYKLIIHCGGCMLTEKEMKRRQQLAREAGVPMVNYGVALAHMTGILPRSIAVFNR